MYLMTYDIGTSFIKTALTNVTDKIEFVGATVIGTHNTTTSDVGIQEQPPAPQLSPHATSAKHLALSANFVRKHALAQELRSTHPAPENRTFP